MLADPDVELMLNFKAGDQLAFRRLFDRYKGDVINYCYRFCGHRGVAEELAQEIFLRVYKAAARYRPEARFRTWLYKIAANVCLNELRRADYRNRFESLESNGEIPGEDPESGPTPTDGNRPDQSLERKERQQLIFAALEQLPGEQRAALLLRVEQDFSYQEIGRQIGRSENHVKTLIHRGRNKVKKMLAAYLGDPP
jgi:RNA polymerase sigma-70 factor (ECF subfamily)